MPSAANIPQKIGFYSLRKTAYHLCQLLTAFGPLIRLYFPDSALLLAALAAAEAACHELVTQIDATRAAIYPP